VKEVTRKSVCSLNLIERTEVNLQRKLLTAPRVSEFTHSPLRIAEEDAIQTEIDVLKQLQHPNIVSMVDLYQTPKHYYLVMQLASGGELFERILERGFYTEKDAAGLVKQLLLALIYIHDEVGIVHRDLKPENLLFQDRSEHSALLITDFGLSRILQKNEFLSSSCGTPHYVAPEILKEAGHSFPVDMWAAGVITFVLLCGYTVLSTLLTLSLFGVARIMI
jgi:calcium/calmodulin-dependent protein kinase I